MQEPFARLPRRILIDDQVPPLGRVLFAALDKELDKRTGRCSPSAAKLAALVGCDRRHVLRLLQVLERSGYVRVHRASGRRNAYELLPADVTGDISVTGPAGVTGDIPVTGTSDTHVTGFASAHHIGELRTEEKEQPAPPPAAALHVPDPHLFAPQHRHWLRTAVDYLLGDQPDLVHLRPWFPALAAELFLARSWQRSTDPATAVLWARRLAGLTPPATDAEATAAFRWALGGLTDGQGRKLFSRPDHLDRIVWRIQSQRRQAAPPPATAAPAATATSDQSASELAWDQAPAHVRDQVVAAVRRTRPTLDPAGWPFRMCCVAELARQRTPTPTQEAPCPAP